MENIRTYANDLIEFFHQRHKLENKPSVEFRQDAQNSQNPLGKTAHYDPTGQSIAVFTTGRHVKDCLRSLAHELQHHTQKCNGDFENVQNMGEEGYAQADPHMRTMEIEAYKASIVFRDWEDSLKETIYYEHLQKGDKSSMSTKNWKNGELKSLLSEAWGFKMDLSNFGKLDEYSGSGVKRGPGDKGDEDEAKKETEGEEDSKREEAGLQEDSGREEGEHYDDDRMSDDDHIKAIEHHLDALLKDRDYDEEHIEEQSKTDRDDRGKRRSAGGRRLDEVVRKLHKAGYSKVQIKEFLSVAYSKALKG